MTEQDNKNDELDTRGAGKIPKGMWFFGLALIAVLLAISALR